MPPSATPPAKKGGTKAGLLPDGPTRDVTAEGPGQNHLLCAEPDAPPPSEAAIPKGVRTHLTPSRYPFFAQGKLWGVFGPLQNRFGAAEVAPDFGLGRLAPRAIARYATRLETSQEAAPSGWSYEGLLEPWIHSNRPTSAKVTATLPCLPFGTATTL